MIFRLCLCCFGFNRNSPNDTKRLLATQSAENANKRNEFYSVHKVSSFGRDVSHDDDGAYSDYEAALKLEKSNPTESKNNNLLPARQYLHSSSNPENETVSDFEESAARTPQGSPVAKKRGHWGKVLKITNRETTKNHTPFESMASVSMMMLPTITVAGSSCSVIGGAENTNNMGSNTLSKHDREVKSLSSSPQTSNVWLKSQSMLNVTCTSDIESDRSSKSTDNVARKYGLDASLYGNTHLSKSMDAVNRAWKSMDDFVNDNGFIDLPNGAIHFIASYKSSTKKLVIQIEKIEGLAPKGADRSKYDCIVKLTMLPHEKHIKFSKTIPAHSTLDLKECFVFNVKDPSKKVLRISVYDSEFLGKYDAVGHALFYVEDALTHEQKSHALKLYRQSMPDIKAGSVKIVLNYNKDTELLNVFIDEAYNLPLCSGKCKSYLKLTQHHFGRKVKTIYSPYVSATQQFRFRFTVDLKIDSSVLQNSFIVVSVKMRTFLKKDTLAGQIILGPFFYAEYGKSLTPWGRALINRETVSHIFRMYL